MEDKRFRAMIVWLIANGKTEEALEQLAQHFGVETPKLKVGLPKGRKLKTLGCYDGKSKTLSVLNSETLKEPLVILHEFYHHIRTGIDTKHKGNERYANEFAKEFIQAYVAICQETFGK